MRVGKDLAIGRLGSSRVQAILLYHMPSVNLSRGSVLRPGKDGTQWSEGSTSPESQPNGQQKTRMKRERKKHQMANIKIEITSGRKSYSQAIMTSK